MERTKPTDPTLQELQQQLVTEALQVIPPQMMGANAFANSVLAKSQVDALTDFVIEIPAQNETRSRREQFEAALLNVLKQRVEHFAKARREKPVIIDAPQGIN